MPDDTELKPGARQAADPRPLVGEPLALDLVNTRWMSAGVRQDLLVDVPGLAVWLAGAGLDQTCPADAPTLTATLKARDALVAVRADPLAGAALNSVLDHGRLRRFVAAGEPSDDIEVDDPAWLPAWLAAHNYTEILRHGSARIRSCANPGCILHFFDSSKNGTRRWCSMAACGNRAKASRHYARSRA